MARQLHTSSWALHGSQTSDEEVLRRSSDLIDRRELGSVDPSVETDPPTRTHTHIYNVLYSTYICNEKT